MKRLKHINHIGLSGCYIAGGAVLSHVTKIEISDYDIYPKIRENISDLIYTILDNDCFLVNISDKALTFKCNSIMSEKTGERAIFQVMTYKDFPTPESIFSNFDYTICMGALDCDTKEYTFHEDFFTDITSKTLRFNPDTLYPLNSLLRLSKYKAKGYYISKPESTKLALAIANKGLPSSWEELESEIGGTYGRELNIARENKEFSYSTAIELLSEIDSFSLYEDENTNAFEGVTADILSAYYEKSTKSRNIIKIENADYIGGGTTQYFELTETYGFIKYPEKLIKATGLPENSKILPPDTRLSGYKVLKKNPKDSSVLLPGIIAMKTGVTYKVGEETSWKQKPYLFVFPDYKTAKDRSYDKEIYEVSFLLSDIKYIGDKEIQVEKLKIEKEVNKDGK